MDSVKRIIYLSVEVILLPLYMVAIIGAFLGAGTWLIDDQIRRWLKQ